MIYWLKKLEWRIRKALGLRKGRKIKTIDDITTFDQELLMKLIIFFFVLIIAREAGRSLGKLWWWFFPRVVRAPMRYL